MRIIEKIHTHWYKGTLFRAIKKTVLRTVGNLDGNRYYGDVAKKYNKRKSSPKWSKENEALASLIADMPEGIKVLDVPFGTGRFVPYYLNKKFEICGVDISRDMLDAAEEALGDESEKCTFEVASAECLPFGDKEFDLVVCFRFLSYIVPFGTMKKTLNELNRVSRKYAVLNVPIRREDARDIRPPKDGEKMLASLKVGALERLFGDSGFSIKETIVTEDSLYYYDAAILCEKIEAFSNSVE